MSAATDRPVLVFDGDCAFCRLWIGYWKALSGDKVEYVSWQTCAKRFPEVPEQDFRKAIQLFDGGKRYSAAEAVFHLLAYGSGASWPLWLYGRVPGVAPLTEAIYRFIAAHRNAGFRVTRLLWGAHVEPPSYRISSGMFARSIALIYAIAFASFGTQVRGLIGEKGIQPVADFFQQALRVLGSNAFWHIPTLFWWVHSDFGLLSIVWSGAVLAAVCSIGRPLTSGQRAGFVVLFVYYLSVVNGGQVFMGYQWDYLLLEAGFLTLFLKPTWARTFLFRWLLFRLMFESGAVKLLSHDPTWRNLTALTYHYQTQPLPTPLAWYMEQSPLWLLKFSTACVFVVELGLPFLIFGPRRLKHIAAWGTIALQLMILLTGNYTFFNFLTIALCLFLFDDASWRFIPRLKPRTIEFHTNRYVSGLVFAGIVLFSFTGFLNIFGVNTPAFLSEPLPTLGQFGVINQYGLFASMTTSRPEISIEGSNDAMDWQPYVFRYKPGPLNRAPGIIEPFQPRLDWQMWFAALSNYRENPWIIVLMQRLLEGSPPVLELFEQNPFSGKPPRYVRAIVYDYQFTTFAERRQTGNWWKRQPKGTYFPPISLKPPQ